MKVKEVRRKQMSFIEALRQKRNVMGAVMLRDMRTRFFNHGLGFLIQSLWPLVHILVVITINTFTGRAAPYGESPLIYFGAGLIPTITFMYISRFMSYSIIFNTSMLSFPIVKVTDILIARAFLELIAGFITLFLLFLIFVVLGLSPYPANPAEAVMAYFATILLAIGIGTISGVITSFLPFFATVYALMGIIVYLSSGALFVTPNLPDQIAIPLSYNPIVQCVEWMRVAYFENYNDRLLNREYLLAFGLGSLFIGLAGERLSRRIRSDQ